MPDRSDTLTAREVIRRRLRNQHLAGPGLARPQDVVSRLLAVQSQDYPAASWGVAQRTRRATQADIDAALNNGWILRTHVMRPTWHFVAPADIRWLLALTAPRVHAASAYRYRQLGLARSDFKRSHSLIERALRGGNALTRPEIAAALQSGGLDSEGQRLAYMVMHAELEALICSGPLRGRQFTYMLLDERAPPAAPKTRDEALAELATRYFTSHGPATVQDCAWWSGLPAADVRHAIQLAGTRLSRHLVGGVPHWSGDASRRLREAGGVRAWLLPNYDEYLIAYRNHDLVIDPGVRDRLRGAPRAPDRHIMVLDGKVVGGWRRGVQRGRIRIEAHSLAPLDAPARGALKIAADAYSRFAGMPQDTVFVKQAAVPTPNVTGAAR
jgi:hypothetical protein